MEVHPDPDRALCDGPNSLALANLESLVMNLYEIHKIVSPKDPVVIGSSSIIVKPEPSIYPLEEKLNKALTAYHKENALSLGMPSHQASTLLGLDNDCPEGLRKKKRQPSAKGQKS